MTSLHDLPDCPPPLPSSGYNLGPLTGYGVVEGSERVTANLLRMMPFLLPAHARFGRATCVLLLTTASITGSPQAAMADAQVHDLTRRNTFTATTTSSTLVRFPNAVSLRGQFASRYEGGGRVYGFILRKVGHFEQEGERPVMQGVSIGKCRQRGCKARETSSSTVCFCDGQLSGLWKLIVIADGAPVTVTFVLKNSYGRLRTEVTDPVTSQIKTLRPTVDETDGNTLYSAGDFTELEQVDFGLVGIWVLGNPHVVSAVDDCVYHEEGLPPPPDDLAFLPGCPTGGSVRPFVEDGDGGSGGVALTSTWYCCPVGLGGWFATVSEVKRHGATALWLDL